MLRNFKIWFTLFHSRSRASSVHSSGGRKRATAAPTSDSDDGQDHARVTPRKRATTRATSAPPTGSNVASGSNLGAVPAIALDLGDVRAIRTPVAASASPVIILYNVRQDLASSYRL